MLRLLMNEFERVTDLPHLLRSQYLASLPEPQEWFLEELVRSGEVWVSSDQGYAVFHGDSLVEFFAVRRKDAHLYLSDLHRLRGFTKVLCKSFDGLLMEAAEALGWAKVEVAFLFRKRTPLILDKTETFQLERARLSDLEEAWANGRDFFDSKDEFEQLFGANGLWIAWSDGQMVGSGIMIPIDGSGDVVDIGMVVRPDQRKNGFASLIVAGLANLLENEGKSPICGCALRNLGSKGALENAGFVSEHRLIRFTRPE